MNRRKLRFFGTLLSKSRSRTYRSKIRTYSFGATLCFLVIAVLLLAFWPRYKIFTLDISTEIAGFIVVDPRFSLWELADATIYLNPISEQPDYKDLKEFSFLQLEKGVSVTVQRHGLGPLNIRLTFPDNETQQLLGLELADLQSVGTIVRSDGESIDLESWASITVRFGNQPKVLPFRGFLTVGDDVANLVDSILLGGSVAVVEEKLLTRGHYIAGEEILNPGDRVRLLNSDRKPVPMDGFLRGEPPPDAFSEPKNALHLTAHGKADHARVDRFGSAGFEVLTKPWTRFVNDPVLAVVFAVIAGLALLLEVFFKLLEIHKKIAASALESRQHQRIQDAD